MGEVVKWAGSAPYGLETEALGHVRKVSRAVLRKLSLGLH